MKKNNSFLNLLKSDFYKISKTGSVFVCPIVIFFLILLNYAVMWVSNKSLLAEDLEVMLTAKDLLFSSTSLALLPIMIAIISSLYIGNEFANGITKNSIARGGDRVEYYFSKIITLCTITSILTVYSFLISAIFYGISCGINPIYSGYNAPFTGTDFGIIVRSFVLQLYCNISATIVFAGLSTLARKPGTSIATCLGIYFIGSIIVVTLQMLTANVSWMSEALSLTPYGILNLSQLDITYNAGDIAKLVMMPLVYSGIAIGVSLYDFIKRDIQ